MTRGEARVGGGTIAFRGSVTDDGVYDGAGEMEGVDFGALAPAPAPDVAFGGRLSGHLEMQGTLSRPRLRATLSSPRLFLGDEGVGALEASLTGTGDGRVTLDGRLPLGPGGPRPRRGGGCVCALRRRPHPAGARRRASTPSCARWLRLPSRSARPRGVRRRAAARPPRGPGRDPCGRGDPHAPASAPRVSRRGARAGAAHVLGRPPGARRPPAGRRGDRPRGDRRPGPARGGSARRSRPAVRRTCGRSPRSRAGCAAPARPGSRWTSPAPAPLPGSSAASISRGPDCACAVSRTASRAFAAACASPSARPSSRT